MSDAAVDPLFLAFQGALAGRYSIDRELGRGGMGVVYLAREVHLDRMVAIKVLPPDKARDASFRERFLREARLAAKLSHPNIIPIHAVEERGEFVFYVMAFIDGETLAQRVRTRGPLGNSEGARVLREVAWALAHAHSHGLVHRDVKPDNILLESSTGRVLVADFGIAAATHDQRGAGVSGTPEFMSPEQALGKDLDPRSDLYGVGATAFFALTGRLPFEGSTATEVLAKQITEAAPPLGSMGMPVSRRLSAIVDRCLAKDPAQRPPTADALAEQLGVALEQRKELPAALRAFVKRNGRLDGGGTMLVPVFGLALSVTTSMLTNGWLGLVAFGSVMIGAPFGYLVHAARGLLKLGFAHSDTAPAFAAEIEQARDEHAAGRTRMTRLEEVLRLTTLGTVVIGAAGFVSWLTGFGVPAWMPILARLALRIAGGHNAIEGLVWTAVAVLPFVSGIVYLSSVQRRRDIDTEFWSRVWTGRIGKLAFSIAKRFLRGGSHATAVTHRATELSLGLAAESLFESLPPATRKSLGDLPAVVRRLQDDAQRLRQLYDQLQDAVSASGEGGSAAHGQLRADRDRIHARLGDAVGALETIRLNLLRLHAGSGDVASLTTHIDVASELSAEVGRMLAARAEVERVIAFPREVATTPV